jgi:hypothetical protein
MEMTNRKNNEKPVFFFKISSCEILPILNFERKLGIVLLERSQESHTALRSLGNILSTEWEKPLGHTMPERGKKSFETYYA